MRTKKNDAQQQPQNAQFDADPGQGATPQGQYSNGQFDGQPNQAHANPGQGYPQQQWAPAPPPKKKNFFVRHKILTGLLALILIAAIGSAMGGGGKKSGGASSSAGSSADSSGGATTGETKADDKAEEKKDVLPALGQQVTDGKFTFTVTKVERDVPSIGGQYMNKKAQGAYTLVHVTVKNTGSETQSMMADGQKAYDAQGIGYEATSDGAFYIEGNDTLFTEINPGNTLKGILVFDAPKGTKLTKVRLHDSMFSNGVEASL